ncbi:hypothetical protein TCAL_14636 [Tigriopus californicus]|uniref:Alanine--glyoxylate aminotransferase 2, mitochondrial n=1 Tax=Tigriopus californicus TaxID=6832 RepID=A0A553P6N4_TIGCA|nr:hypothetical protein TCAL_14636 [Tigriopus californicus]
MALDHSGKRYLDLFGGIVTVSVGHCHPKVNQALKDQVDTLWHTTNIYLPPKIHEYAERLVATLPEPLTNVYFVNSGQCLASEQYLEQLERRSGTFYSQGQEFGWILRRVYPRLCGTVQYPKGYLKKAFQKVRDLGGVCISDEGIGNGFPMAALVTTKEIADVMSQAIHFNTFGGNPMASAVGIAVLDALKEDRCQENSANTIGDVRGKGLMIGIEMVEDKDSRKPLAGAKMMAVWEDVKNMGVLLGKGGLNGNVFRIKPPMCITKEDVNVALEIFKIALDKNGMK